MYKLLLSIRLKVEVHCGGYLGVTWGLLGTGFLLRRTIRGKTKNHQVQEIPQRNSRGDPQGDPRGDL